MPVSFGQNLNSLIFFTKENFFLKTKMEQIKGKQGNHSRRLMKGDDFVSSLSADSLKTAELLNGEGKKQQEIEKSQGETQKDLWSQAVVRNLEQRQSASDWRKSKKKKARLRVENKNAVDEESQYYKNKIKYKRSMILLLLFFILPVQADLNGHYTILQEKLQTNYGFYEVMLYLYCFIAILFLLYNLTRLVVRHVLFILISFIICLICYLKNVSGEVCSELLNFLLVSYLVVHMKQYWLLFGVVTFYYLQYVQAVNSFEFIDYSSLYFLSIGFFQVEVVFTLDTSEFIKNLEKRAYGDIWFNKYSHHSLFFLNDNQYTCDELLSILYCKVLFQHYPHSQLSNEEFVYHLTLGHYDHIQFCSKHHPMCEYLGDRVCFSDELKHRYESYGGKTKDHVKKEKKDRVSDGYKLVSTKNNSHECIFNAFLLSLDIREYSENFIDYLKVDETDDWFVQNAGKKKKDCDAALVPLFDQAKPKFFILYLASYFNTKVEVYCPDVEQVDRLNLVSVIEPEKLVVQGRLVRLCLVKTIDYSHCYAILPDGNYSLDRSNPLMRLKNATFGCTTLPESEIAFRRSFEFQQFSEPQLKTVDQIIVNNEVKQTAQSQQNIINETVTSSVNVPTVNIGTVPLVEVKPQQESQVVLIDEESLSEVNSDISEVSIKPKRVSKSIFARFKRLVDGTYVRKFREWFENRNPSLLKKSLITPTSSTISSTRSSISHQIVPPLSEEDKEEDRKRKAADQIVSYLVTTTPETQVAMIAVSDYESTVDVFTKKYVITKDRGSVKAAQLETNTLCSTTELVLKNRFHSVSNNVQIHQLDDVKKASDDFLMRELFVIRDVVAIEKSLKKLLFRTKLVEVFFKCCLFILSVLYYWYFESWIMIVGIISGLYFFWNLFTLLRQLIISKLTIGAHNNYKREEHRLACGWFGVSFSVLISVIQALCDGVLDFFGEPVRPKFFKYYVGITFTEIFFQISCFKAGKTILFDVFNYIYDWVFFVRVLFKYKKLLAIFNLIAQLIMIYYDYGYYPTNLMVSLFLIHSDLVVSIICSVKTCTLICYCFNFIIIPFFYGRSDYLCTHNILMKYACGDLDEYDLYIDYFGFYNTVILTHLMSFNAIIHLRYIFAILGFAFMLVTSFSGMKQFNKFCQERLTETLYTFYGEYLKHLIISGIVSNNQYINQAVRIFVSHGGGENSARDLVAIQQVRNVMMPSILSQPNLMSDIMCVLNKLNLKNPPNLSALRQKYDMQLENNDDYGSILSHDTLICKKIFKDYIVEQRNLQVVDDDVGAKLRDVQHLLIQTKISLPKTHQYINFGYLNPMGQVLYSNCVQNAVAALKKRVAMIVPKPQVKDDRWLNYLLHYHLLIERCKDLDWTLVFPKMIHNKIDELYSKQTKKKNRYHKAYDEAKDQNIVDISRISFMVKTGEPVDESKRKPRAIMYQSSGYLTRFGLTLKNFEHVFYRKFKVNLDDSSPDIAKGLNMIQRAKIVKYKMLRIHEPVVLELDCSAFDAHVSVEQLSVELAGYLSLIESRTSDNKLISDHCEAFGHQINKRVKFNNETGKMTFKLHGNRESGSWNTSLGNTMIMITMLWTFIDYYNISGKEYSTFNDGDDNILIVSKKTLHLFLDNLTDFFLILGHELKVEVKYRISDIKFCQHHYVEYNNRTCFMRNPDRFLQRFSLSGLKYQSVFDYKLLKTRALAECLTYPNHPIIYPFFKKLYEGIIYSIDLSSIENYLNVYQCSVDVKNRLHKIIVLDKMDPSSYSPYCEAVNLPLVKCLDIEDQLSLVADVIIENQIELNKLHIKPTISWPMKTNNVVTRLRVSYIILFLLLCEQLLYWSIHYGCNSLVNVGGFQQTRPNTTICNSLYQISEINKTPKFNLVQKKDLIYCVHMHFRQLGFTADNKVHNYDDLVKTTQENNINMVIDDGKHQALIDNDSPRTLIGLITEKHDHLHSLFYYSNTPIDGLLKTDDFQLAMPKQVVEEIIKKTKRNRRPKKVSIVVNEKVENKKKQRSKLNTIAKEIKRVTAKDMRPTNKRGKQVIKVVSTKVLSESVGPMAKQLMLPYESKKLIRWYDNLNTDVGIQKSWRNVTVSPTLYGNNWYLGVIHGGDFFSQYLVTVPYPQNLLTYVFCDFATSDASQSSALKDKYLESNSQLEPELNNSYTGSINQTITIPIPLRTGTSTNSADGSLSMVTFSDVVDGNNNSIPSGLTTTSGPTDTAFFTCSNNTSNVYDSFIVTFTANAAFTGTYSIIWYFGFGTTVSQLTIGSVSATSSNGTQNVSIPWLSSIATGCDRTYGIALVMTPNSGQNVNCTLSTFKFSVKIYDSATSPSSPPAYVPWSVWQSTPIPSSAAIRSIISKFRNIASSILYTDFSNVLNVSGQVSVAQVVSRRPPSESGITGIGTIGEYNGNKTFKETSGYYSFDYKLVDIESSTFRAIDDTWNGVQPYTMSYTVIPNSGGVVPIMRLQIADILEYNLENNQIFATETGEDKPEVMKLIKEYMTEYETLYENPMHLGMIGDLFKKIVGGAKQIMPYVNLAAQASGNGTAMKVAGVASNVLDCI